jgi:hypothetical protein
MDCLSRTFSADFGMDSKMKNPPSPFREEGVRGRRVAWRDIVTSNLATVNVARQYKPFFP